MKIYRNWFLWITGMDLSDLIRKNLALPNEAPEVNWLELLWR